MLLKNPESAKLLMEAKDDLRKLFWDERLRRMKRCCGTCRSWIVTDDEEDDTGICLFMACKKAASDKRTCRNIDEAIECPRCKSYHKKYARLPLANPKCKLYQRDIDVETCLLQVGLPDYTIPIRRINK